MNNLVWAQIQAIEKEASRLAQTLHDLQSHVDALEKEKGEILQKRWSLERQVNALQRMADDYERVDSEAKLLRERHAEIRSALGRMRERAKAIAEFLRQ